MADYEEHQITHDISMTEYPSMIGGTTYSFKQGDNHINMSDLEYELFVQFIRIHRPE